MTNLQSWLSEEQNKNFAKVIDIEPKIQTKTYKLALNCIRLDCDFTSHLRKQLLAAGGAIWKRDFGVFILRQLTYLIKLPVLCACNFYENADTRRLSMAMNHVVMGMSVLLTAGHLTRAGWPQVYIVFFIYKERFFSPSSISFP